MTSIRLMVAALFTMSLVATPGVVTSPPAVHAVQVRVETTTIEPPNPTGWICRRLPAPIRKICEDAL